MNIKNMKTDLMEAGFMKSLIKFSNTNFVAKTLTGLFIWFIALIPAYIFFLIRWAVDPLGFWQELALLFVFAVVAGWVQALTIFLAVVITLMLIFDEF